MSWQGYWKSLSATQPQRRYIPSGVTSQVGFFGGYNILLFGDLYQLPPIPATAAIFTPPTETKTEAAKTILNMFWSNDANSINSFVELTIQKRIGDDWYARVMDECRMGALSEDSYNYLHGFPTEHCGSWLQDDSTSCGRVECMQLAPTWKEMAARGSDWSDMVRLECKTCHRSASIETDSSMKQMHVSKKSHM